MNTTRVFSMLVSALLDPTVRIILMPGSTRSSKTWSTLQALNYVAAKSKRPRLISVVSETMPHLKKGAIRDFKNILEGDEVYDSSKWHDTDKTYTYKFGKLEFFSADQPSKVMGPARDWLYINEGINISFEIYRQLAIRTTEKIIIDYNPAFEFWADTKLAVRDDVRVIRSTYLDNDNLSAAQVAEIESNREVDPDWWLVYGLGQTGSKEGLVIKNWDIVDTMPKEFKKQWLAIDYGWSAPTAIMHIGLGEKDEVYIDELAYLPNLDNPDIYKIIKESGLDHLEVLADIAEPKSNSELRTMGLNVAEKINKDIKLGLRVMNRYKKHYTARSLGSIAENRQYRYGKDADGNQLQIPIDAHNHAKDAERYVFLNRLSNISAGYDVTF